MKIKLLALAGGVILVVAVWLSSSAMSSSPNLYDLKRLQEKVFMAVRLKPKDKVGYYLVLLDERLKELKFLVESRQSEYILSSSLRYSTTAGLMTETIKTYRMVDDAGKALEKFGKHQRIIKMLDDSYPKDEDEEWKFIQDDYNYLAIYSQQLTDTFGDGIQIK